MTQSLGLDREGMVLAGLWVGGVDALQTHRECGRLLGPFAGVGAEVGEFSLCVGMVLIRHPVCRERVLQFGTTEAVEQVTVLVEVAQPPLVGLPVHSHEVLADLGQDTDRRHAAPDMST